MITKGECFDLLSNSLNKFFKELYKEITLEILRFNGLMLYNIYWAQIQSTRSIIIKRKQTEEVLTFPNNLSLCQDNITIFLKLHIMDFQSVCQKQSTVSEMQNNKTVYFQDRHPQNSILQDLHAKKLQLSKMKTVINVLLFCCCFWLNEVQIAVWDQ